MSWDYEVQKGIATREVCADLLWDDLLREAEGHEDADSLIESAVDSQVNHEMKFKEYAGYIYYYDLEDEPVPNAEYLRRDDIYGVLRETVRADLIRHLGTILDDLLVQRAEGYDWNEIYHKWVPKS